MPEQEIRQPLRPLEVETRQRTELLYFFTYQKRGALAIASDHLVVGKGNNAVRVGREGLREATYRTDGFLGLDLAYWNGDRWNELPLPYGVQYGLPARDILGILMIEWELSESVPGWSRLDSCELFPEQFKILRWPQPSIGSLINVFAIPFFTGIILLFMRQEQLANVLIFGPLLAPALILWLLSTTFCSRIFLYRDKLTILSRKSPKLEFAIEEIEQVEIEIESRKKGMPRKRLSLCLKNKERIPLCTFRREWQTAEASLLDALRSRDVPIVVPGYE